MKRRIVTLLLALCMVLGLAATVSAEERYTSGDWTYTFSEGELSIISYNGSDTHVVVPEKLDGHPVRILGWGLTPAFSGVKNTMTSITLPEGLTHIERQCFKNCAKLTSVTLPSTVEYVSSSAFEGCSKLAKVELNEGLKSIGEFAFLNTALTSLYIPASVTDIGTEAIGYTGEWGNTVRVDDFTIYGYTGSSAEWYAWYWNFDFVDMGANYDNSGRCGDSLYWEFTASTGTLLIYGPPSSTGGYMYDYAEDEIPWAVHKPFIKSVVMECGMDITNYAFQDCAELTTVTMADTVETIRSCAFKNTPKLTDVKLSANLDFISTAAFSGSGLTSIELPDGLRSIGTEAFWKTPLTSIEIPDSVELSQGVFYYCTELTSVKLPADLEEINPLLFDGCTSLKSIDLPDTITHIGRQAFSHSGLTAIEIPDCVTFIDENAFYECKSLEYVKLPASLEEAGWRCFQDCDKLSTIVMPEGITTNFGQWFFLSCDSLTDIDFHTAPIIGFFMYQDCDNLTVLNIPDCVTTIDMQAFAYCDQLSYVTIPAGVTDFGAKVFYECPKLNAIAFRGDAPVFHDVAFDESTVTCYYPAGNATWTEEVRQSYGGTVTWVAYEPMDFIDVPVNSFYYESVLWAVDNGITTGATATTFNPNGQCQRAQIVTFLWRAAGCPVVEAENPFTDVKETDFYYDAVLWAVENGITTGTSADTFSPFKTCTRAEVVTFLWRAHGKPGSNAANPFVDVKDTDFFHTAVLWAVENGITNGMDATHFGSLTVCNRAQVVTFLYRAKDVAVADPDAKYTFELKTNDPTEEIGWAYCEGTAFAAGESVLFYAEPWFGYLVDFEAEGELELYYLGACNYELIMPDHDVTLTVNFVPAQGDAHHIRTTCKNGEFYALCDVDEDFNDIAKPGEFVQFYVMANEGYTLTPENITLTVGGESWAEWWFLGQVSEPDPELELGSIFVFETVMPDSDLDVSITCTAGGRAAAQAVRVPVSVK